MDRAVITLGADVGGPDAFVGTNSHIRELRELLARECKGPYSEAIKEIALVLRVDGSVQSWRKLGVANVRLQVKRSYATADIFVPTKVWDVPHEFRRFAAESIRDACTQIAQRSARKRVTLHEKRLSHDIERAISQYLASDYREQLPSTQC